MEIEIRIIKISNISMHLNINMDTPYVNTASKTTFYRTQLAPVTLYPVLRWHKAILVPALNLKAPEAIFVSD